MSKHHILVVDDEPLNLEIIKEHLRDLPYTCTTASDGAEAWKILQENPSKFSAILLDRMMPNMDGMAVLKNIKNDQSLKHIPIILQTAKASSKDIAEGIAAGAHYYLTKPFDNTMLKTMLRSAIEDYKAHTELTHQINQCSRAMKLLRSGKIRFTCRTLTEGKDLATLMSGLFPDSGRVVNGLTELVTNAIEHGNLGISYDEKSQLLKENRWLDEIEKRLQQDPYQSRQVVIEYEKNETFVRILITDEGEGFEWGKYLVLDPARAFDTHGRGIALANLMSFDQLTYNEKGNQVKASIVLTIT